MFLTDDGHPRDEQLLASVHEPQLVTAAMRSHLAECQDCRARRQQLEDEERDIAGLLQLLDHPLPAIGEVIPDVFRRRRRIRRALVMVGTAATLALAAAATMLPSSPVHRILTGTGSGAAVAAVQPPVTPSSPAVEAPLASGIAIHAPRSLEVQFDHDQVFGKVILTRVSGRDAVFRSRGGKTNYEVAAGRVRVDNQLPAESYLIDLPASVHEIRILIGQRVLFRWPEDSARFITGPSPTMAQVPFQPREVP